MMSDKTDDQCNYVYISSENRQLEFVSTETKSYIEMRLKNRATESIVYLKCPVSRWRELVPLHLVIYLNKNTNFPSFSQEDYLL